MLWRVPSYSAPGLPRPTISQSTSGAPRGLLAVVPALGLAGSLFAGCLLALLAGGAFGHQLGLLLDLFLGLDLPPRRRESGHNGLRIVSQGNALRRSERLERDRVADLQLGHVVVDGIRDVTGQSLDRQLARDLLEHTALLDAGRVLSADQVEHHGSADRLVKSDAQHVDVDRHAADRVAGQLLDDHGRGAGAVDAELEHRARVLEGVAQLPLIDLEGDRILATPVDDSGDAAGTPQATRRTRSRDLAALDWKGCALSRGHDRPRW